MKIDATLPDFTPWWETATIKQMNQGIAKLRRARHYCRGRAVDLAPILDAHIRRLESIREGKDDFLRYESER